MGKELSYSRLRKFIDNGQHAIWHTYSMNKYVRLMTLISDSNMVIFALIIPDSYKIHAPHDAEEITTNENGISFVRRKSTIDIQSTDMHTNIKADDEEIDPFAELDQLSDSHKDEDIVDKRPPSPVESLREAESGDEREVRNDPVIELPDKLAEEPVYIRTEYNVYMRQFMDIIKDTSYGLILFRDNSITCLSNDDVVETFFRGNPTTKSSMYPNLSQIYVSIDIEQYFEARTFVSDDMEGMYKKIHEKVRDNISTKVRFILSLESELRSSLHKLDSGFADMNEHAQLRINEYMRKFKKLKLSRVRLLENIREYRRNNTGKSYGHDPVYSAMENKLEKIDNDLNNVQKYIINSRSYINSLNYTSDREVHTLYITLNEHLSSLNSMLMPIG